MWMGLRMELRKRPRPRRLHPDLVLSPQPTPPRTRPRKQNAEKGPRRAAAEKRPALSKRARCGLQRVGSRAAGAGLQPCRFEQDMWTEVAKHLQRTDLLSLSATCMHTPCPFFFSATFNRNRFDTPCVKNILNAESWIRGRSNLLPRAYLTPVGDALSTNLMPKCGLLSRFHAMRDTTRDGQIVSVRITQHLLL